MSHKDAKRLRKILRKEVEQNMGEFFKMVEEFTLRERLILVYRIIFKRLHAKKLNVTLEKR